jgi:hypothetical protein
MFLLLVLAHARVIRALNDARRWLRVNRDAKSRVTGAWRELPETGRRFSDPQHPYAEDLDMFGVASLFQRLSVAHTSFGQNCLAGFLREPAGVATVRDRQETVRALAPELELRQKLEACALAISDESLSESASKTAHREAPDPDPLLRWAEGDTVLGLRRWLVWSSRLLPVVTLSGIALSSFSRAPIFLWSFPLVLQLGLLVLTQAECARVFTAVSNAEGAFVRYGAMLELIEELHIDSTLVKGLQSKLMSVGPKSATEKSARRGERPSVRMKEFENKVGWFNLRHNGLVHPLINWLLLWDIHCVLALEAWQKRSGRVARGWFEAVGEMEALCSFAALAHDEPGYVFPELREGPASFRAHGLGHPLIDRGRRVDNDLSLPEPQTALLVTGSNMSGKSTLLRTMGLAAVMAQAGAPVCARQFELSPLAVRTSIHVSDSLERGISAFYAELVKLRAVLGATDGGMPVLFLLDEILHGTNSAERQIGARWLLSQLLARGAIGVVSTHDLGLCQLTGELAQRVHQAHFRENVENDKMTFDYKLRPGPVASGNALRLMRVIGLDVPLAPP